MEINKTKSSIIYFNQEIDPQPSIRNIPVSHSYKYLGLILNKQLSITQHLDYIQRKILFINNQLTPIRRLHRTHTTINLFKLFILPQYRLGFSLFSHSSALEQRKLISHMKRTLKRWLCIPINTADNTLYSFLDIPRLINFHTDKIRHNTRRIYNITLPTAASAPELNIKYFPPPLIKITQIMYGSKCFTHNIINNTEHVTNEHGLDSIRNLMALFNTPSRKQRK